MTSSSQKGSSAERITLFLVLALFSFFLGGFASSSIRQSGIEQEVKLSKESKKSILEVVEDYSSLRIALGSTPRVGLGPGLAELSKFKGKFRRAKNSLCTYGAKKLLGDSVDTLLQGFNYFVSDREKLSSLYVKRSTLMIELATIKINKCTLPDTYLAAK